MSSLEKSPVVKDAPRDVTTAAFDASDADAERAQSVSSTAHLLSRWNAHFESATNLESRGVQRIPADERLPHNAFNYWSIGLIWMSCQLGPSVSTFAMTGPIVYQLSFLDCALCAVFGAALGSAAIAGVGIWGPRSGNRTMIVTRWFFGYWPTKLITLLQIVILIGYALIGDILAGQILNAVSGGKLDIVVGIIICSVITLVISLVGVRWLHHYDRWSWIPQLVVFFILVGSAGSQFNTSTPSIGNPETINASRLSFFSICLSAPIAWAPAAADYFTYHSEATKPGKYFLIAFVGNFLPLTFDLLLGIALGSGVATNSEWADAYATSQGALVYAGLTPLGPGFAGVCGTILALSIIAYNVPGTYSAALGFQILGRYGLAVPRWTWVVFTVVVYTVCACAGREKLFEIFSSFLPLMGYWVVIWLVIMFQEHFIFNRGDLSRYQWDAWNDRKRLPVGLAALVSFLVGYAGAILSMDQAHWIGPLARLVGDQGADLGLWVAIGFTLVVFPPLRWLELRIIGR